MIVSFKHKGSRELFEKGKSAKIHHDYHKRCLVRLDALDVAENLDELDLPGFNFHGLEGRPKRYSIHVKGPFCITFEWHEGKASRLDFENYH